MVVVYINAGESMQYVAVQAEGIAVKSWTTYTTDIHRNLEPGPQVQAGQTYILPAKAIVTFLGEFVPDAKVRQ